MQCELGCVGSPYWSEPCLGFNVCYYLLLIVVVFVLEVMGKKLTYPLLVEYIWQTSQITDVLTRMFEDTHLRSLRPKITNTYMNVCTSNKGTRWLGPQLQSLDLFYFCNIYTNLDSVISWLYFGGLRSLASDSSHSCEKRYHRNTLGELLQIWL